MKLGRLSVDELNTVQSKHKRANLNINNSAFLCRTAQTKLNWTKERKTGLAYGELA